MQGHIVAKQTTIYVANTKIDSEDVSLGRGIPASSRGTSRLGNWYKDVQNETNNAIRVAKQKYFKSIIWRNKGDPRKALRTRPQPTTSVPVIGESPGNEVGGITYVKMPTSALCTCISFSLVLCFFKTLCTLNSNFTFECYFTKSVQDSGGSEGRIGAHLIFRPAVQISLPLCICSYT